MIAYWPLVFCVIVLIAVMLRRPVLRRCPDCGSMRFSVDARNRVRCERCNRRVF